MGILKAIAGLFSQSIFVDEVTPGQYFNGKKIVAVEPPDKLCDYWLVHLAGETVPRTFGKGSQVLVQQEGENK